MRRYCTRRSRAESMANKNDSGQQKKRRLTDNWSDIEDDSDNSKMNEIDDMVRYKNKTYALHKQGKLFSFCSKTKKWSACRVLGDSWEPQEIIHRKRLAVLANKLYLVVLLKGHTPPDTIPQGAFNVYIKVYVLNLVTNSKVDYLGSWDEVKSFGRIKQVLCVFKHHCFFVSAAEFSRCQFKDCIIFSKDAFPTYSKGGWSYKNGGHNKVGVFSLSACEPYSWSAQRYTAFPTKLFSPSPWPVPHVSDQSQSEQEENEVTEDNSNSEESSSSKEKSQCEAPTNAAQEDTIRPVGVNGTEGASEQEEDEATADNPDSEESSSSEENSNRSSSSCEASSSSDEKSNECNPSRNFSETPTSAAQAENSRPDGVNDMECSTEEAMEIEYLETPIIQTPTDPHVGFHSVETLKTQGIDVSHLPILEKVLKKYGDVVAGSALRSSASKSMAWTHLANILLILQENSGNTLTDAQARDLPEALNDLKEVMKLKVDWLEPFVGKASKIQRFKQLQISLAKLEDAKARAEELTQKLLSEMEETKQGLDNDIKLVSETLGMFGSIDLRERLDEGMF